MLRLLKVVVGALIVSALTPGVSQAETIKFAGTGFGSQVTIGGTSGANYHGSVFAGELDWQWVGTAPAGFATSFYAYCVDLSSFLRSEQTVTPVSSTGFSNGVIDGGKKAAWLFNEYAAGIHSNIATASMNAAALQIAIWEAMYDGSANLGGGAFTATTSNSQILSQATTYLNALYASTPWTAVATILSTSSGQDQITQVSEPSTLLIIGLAFFGFAALARRPARQT